MDQSNKYEFQNTNAAQSNLSELEGFVRYHGFFYAGENSKSLVFTADCGQEYSVLTDFFTEAKLRRGFGRSQFVSGIVNFARGTLAISSKNCENEHLSIMKSTGVVEGVGLQMICA